jgi:CheY-like chemotaxis protein
MSLMENARAPLDVLIAEDDGDLRLAVRQLLEDEGYACAEAEDGRVAVEVARQCPPRLVLLDLMMPAVDGFAAARQLRADPLTHGVRIHCLTALDFPAARSAAREAGCDGFLPKPFTADQLLDAVRRGVYALRAEDEAVVQAAERLGKTLAARVPGRERLWGKQLGSALVGLEDALRQHAVQMDAPDGWLAQVDLSRNTLARRLGGCRREQGRLFEQMHALLAQVRSAIQAFQAGGEPSAPLGALPEPAAAQPVDFNQIRQAGERLLAAVNRHIGRERDLLFESINTDIGVGD